MWGFFIDSNDLNCRTKKVGVRHAGGMPQGNLSDYKLVCSKKVSGLQHAGRIRPGVPKQEPVVQTGFRFSLFGIFDSIIILYYY